MKRDALPLQEAISILMGKPVNLVLMEDNAAVILAIKKGYSAALRSISRSLKVCLGSLHEACFEGFTMDELYG